MSDITDWEPLAHPTDIIKDFSEMHSNCNALADRLDDANKIIDLLQQKNTLQVIELIAVREKARNRITSMKQEVKQELKAVEMILMAICASNSAHWQKKENLRLCLEILSKIPTFDCGLFFNYEDDF